MNMIVLPNIEMRVLCWDRVCIGEFNLQLMQQTEDGSNMNQSVSMHCAALIIFSSVVHFVSIWCNTRTSCFFLSKISWKQDI